MTQTFVERCYTLLADNSIVADYDLVAAPREAWLLAWQCLAEGCHADPDIPCPCGRVPIVVRAPAPDEDGDVPSSCNITLEWDERTHLLEACAFMQRHFRRQGNTAKARKFDTLFERLYALGE